MEQDPKGPVTRAQARTRFAPNLDAASRRPATKADCRDVNSGSSTNETVTPSTQTSGNRGGNAGGRTWSSRGSGRGRGGVTNGLLARGGGLTQTAVASGPFAQGPAASIKQSRSSISTAGIGMAPSLTGHRSERATSRSGIAATINDHDDMPVDAENFQMEDILSRRREGLPISLNALSSNTGKKDTSLPSSALPEKAQERIEDDCFIDSRDLLANGGQLMLFQLPSCLPHLASDMNDAKNLTSTTSSSSSLLSAGESEKAMDIDTFKSIQQAQEKQAQKSIGWSLACDGLYGKLRVHASGRVSLLINGSVYYAVPSNFRTDVGGMQRVVAIDADYQQSFDLGSLVSHYIFVPDSEQLLSSVAINE